VGFYALEAATVLGVPQLNQTFPRTDGNRSAVRRRSYCSNTPLAHALPFLLARSHIVTAQNSSGAAGKQSVTVGKQGRACCFSITNFYYAEEFTVRARQIGNP
jgi:hypothetical protein